MIFKFKCHILDVKHITLFSDRTNILLYLRIKRGTTLSTKDVDTSLRLFVCVDKPVYGLYYRSCTSV